MAIAFVVVSFAAGLFLIVSLFDRRSKRTEIARAMRRRDKAAVRAEVEAARRAAQRRHPSAGRRVR